MSVDDQVAQLRAEIEQLETTGALEARLVELKESGQRGTDEYNQVKRDLREARRAHRAKREAAASDAAVAADVIESSTSLEG